MQRTTAVSVLCAFLLIVAGCVDGGPLLGGGDTPQESTDTSPTATPECDPEMKDGSVSNCLIEARPANMEVTNEDTRNHSVSVRLVHNGTNLVVSETLSLGTSGPASVERYRDVFDTPGTYNLTVTVDDTTTVTETVGFDRRYGGSGGYVVRVLIGGETNVTISTGLGPA